MFDEPVDRAVVDVQQDLLLVELHLQIDKKLVNNGTDSFHWLRRRTE